MRKEADLYKKIVYWSDEDNCFIGMCPELMYGGVHGDDPIEVFKELNKAVEEVIAIFKEDGKPLPALKVVTLHRQPNSKLIKKTEDLCTHNKL